jgi:hypothetical protein
MDCRMVLFRVWRRTLFAAGSLLCLSAASYAEFGGLTSAEAVTVGSNLAAGANDSLCKFQSLEPETHFCTVGQVDLDVGHTATGGLVSPFDGVIVQWSVRTGVPLPGTGPIKLALRTMPPGYLERGPEVELPPSPPGSRHIFPERLPVSAGQPIAVKMSVANRSTQEAGVPISFREEKIGTIDTWAGEQFESIWEGWEENVELLLDAEVEPDGDHDGYGDLTQDCFPNEPGTTQSCDWKAPAIRLRVAGRQNFLHSGAIRIWVSLNETGSVRVAGQLGVKGRRSRWTSHLRGDSGPVAAGGWTALRLHVRKRALRAARLAACDGKAIVVAVRMAAVDGQGNERQEFVQVRPKAQKVPARCASDAT